LSFNDEELEEYMRLRLQADSYLNLLIRLKRLKDMEDVEDGRDRIGAEQMAHSTTGEG
jgi:hypothetical protein